MTMKKPVAEQVKKLNLTEVFTLSFDMHFEKFSIAFKKLHTERRAVVGSGIASGAS